MESLVLYGFGEWFALSVDWTVIGLLCDVSMDNFWSAIVLVCGGSVDDDDDDAVEVVEDVVDKLLLVLVFLMHVGHSCGSCCSISVSGDIEMSAIMPLSKVIWRVILEALWETGFFNQLTLTHWQLTDQSCGTLMFAAQGSVWRRHFVDKF